MTPSKVQGSNNYLLERVYRGVRLQISSGTGSLTEYRRRDAILTKLKEAGAVETWRLLKSGDLTIDDLVDADRSGRLLQAADRLKLHKPLKPEMEKWLETSTDAKEGRRRYETSWRAFYRQATMLAVRTRRKGLVETSTIADLANVDYKRLRRDWEAGPSDFNKARACVSAFLTHYLGHVHHPFRLEVMRYYKTKPEPVGRMPDLTPEQFWTIIEQADERLRAAYVAMAILGVGPKEYLSLTRAHLKPLLLEVHVPGTKRRERDRMVSVDKRYWAWVDRAVPSPLHDRWLRNWFNRATKAAKLPGVQMYDLRHLSAQFAGDEGATDRDLTVHMGHSRVDTSHRYSRRRTARKVARAAADALWAAEPKGLRIA